MAMAVSGLYPIALIKVPYQLPSWCVGALERAAPAAAGSQSRAAGAGSLFPQRGSWHRASSAHRDQSEQRFPTDT